MLSPITLQTARQRRYATKSFDPSKKVPADQLDVLIESIRLAPSSFGLQPWKIVHVQTPELRQQLLPHTRGQPQIIDASDLFVLCRPLVLDHTFVDQYIESVCKTRGVTREELGGYPDMMYGFLDNADEAKRKLRAHEQVNIALGCLLETAALLEIDACPVGGFVPEQYDEVLGLAKQGLTAVVVCPLGYRKSEDKYATMPKVRYTKEKIYMKM